LAFLADAILAIHLSWIAFVIFGAFWTRGRPAWTTLHLLSLLWGILVEVGPWPCPVTLAEQWAEARADMRPWHGSFLMHRLDALIYPTLPYWVVTTLGVTVCAANLAIYLWRFTSATGRPGKPRGQ
jgi:Protein of Unknown function (DUF2784)